ncbi:uncharacterized protein LOC100907290 [Galendromus occidentalis]|uniref:Uncharacterized protein LOC100907290 n=1 Tax=Galendromus occidentalis TaxID=34638 RepID=A0AAJ6VZP8_9ACAR|nr:uncharacterized protein LOC100907290 [Galendromus occidentalis]
MALDDTDDEVVTDPVTSPPKETPAARIDNAKSDDVDKDKIESPPRSPDREKTDLEKHVSLDMTNGDDIRLDDVSDDRYLDKLDGDFTEEQLHNQENRRLVAFSWILLVQFGQWLIIGLGGLLSAIVNGVINYHDSVYISLTLIFALVFIGHLCYFSLMQNLESYQGNLSVESLSRERYLNVCKLISLTFTMCGFTYAVTGTFTQISFNVVAMSVLLSLMSIFILSRVFRIFPQVRILLNVSLLAAVFALNIWGFSLCDQFGSAWRSASPLTLVAAAFFGFLISAGILIQSRSFAIDRVQQKIAMRDCGCAATLNIYTVFINKVWVKLVGEELYNHK